MAFTRTASPAPGKLLRQAGQSLREEINRLCEERLIPFLFIPLMFIIVWIVECVQKYAGRNLDPQFWAFIALLVTTYGGFEIFRLRPRLRRLRLGERGERSVGEILDLIRAKGFVAVHDLPGDGFNVDHVVVGPTGVYVIETKTRSGSGTIEYHASDELVFGGKISDNRPLSQARSNAYAVHAHLKEHLREYFWVKPVVVFVGNWRVRREAGDYDVDVVTADQLENYFDRQQPELTSKDIARIRSHLERSARA